MAAVDVDVVESALRDVNLSSSNITNKVSLVPNDDREVRLVS